MRELKKDAIISLISYGIARKIGVFLCGNTVKEELTALIKDLIITV